jgi:hypothetical protein
MPAYPEHLLFLLVDACLTDLRSGGHEMLAATKAAALLVQGGIHPSSLCLWICETDVGHLRHDGSVNSGPRAASRLLRLLLLLRACSKVVRIEDLLRFFYIYFALIFENKWSNQKFLEIYIWRHTPTAVRHDVRGGANGRLYCLVGSDFYLTAAAGILAPWPTAPRALIASQLYKRLTPCRCRPLPHSFKE